MSGAGGIATDEVMVTSPAPLLNTENANLSAHISAKQVVELLNQCNVYGVATQKSTGGGSVGTADQDIPPQLRRLLRQREGRRRTWGALYAGTVKHATVMFLGRNRFPGLYENVSCRYVTVAIVWKRSK